MSRNEELVKKLSALEKPAKASGPPLMNPSILSGNQEDTFDIRNMQTGLSARSPSGENARESQGVLPIGTHHGQNILS